MWLGSPHLLVVSEIAFVSLRKFKLCSNFPLKGFHILWNLVEKHSLLVHHSQIWISLQRKGYQSRYVTWAVFADTAASRNWDFPENEYIPWERTLVGDEVELTQSCYYIKLCLKFKWFPHFSPSHAHWNWCHLIFSLMWFLAWSF